VLEEIGMVEDTPDDLVFELHNELLWGKHPYGYSILGTRETVTSLGVDDLRALHTQAYHPAQLIVAASGNVQHDDLIAVLDRTGWRDIAARTSGPVRVPEPRMQPPAMRHVHRDGAQTHVVIGTQAVSHQHPRRFALLLLSILLGGGMSSRLFQRVREELGLAFSVFTYQSFHADCGMHGVYVATAPDSAAEALAAIRAELQRVADDGLPESEIEMGKQQLKGQLTLSLESVSSRMYRAASVELYGEPFRSLDEVLAIIDAISVSEIAEVARDYFAPDRMTVLSLGPRGV
jgi:predicted Zn-dependent peptidase